MEIYYENMGVTDFLIKIIIDFLKNLFWNVIIVFKD